MTKIMDTEEQNIEFLNSRYSDVTLKQTQIQPGFVPKPAGCLYEDVIMNITTSVRDEGEPEINFRRHLVDDLDIGSSQEQNFE